VIRNSNLITCEVQGSHRSVVNDSGLLGCDPEVLGEWFPIFPSTVLLSSLRYIETSGNISQKTQILILNIAVMHMASYSDSP
jgi:hypothetical protein